MAALIAFVYFCAVMNVSVKALGSWETTVRKIFLSVHQILANMEELVSKALTITTAPVGQVTILYSLFKSCTQGFPDADVCVCL